MPMMMFNIQPFYLILFYVHNKFVNLIALQYLQFEGKLTFKLSSQQRRVLLPWQYAEYKQPWQAHSTQCP